MNDYEQKKGQKEEESRKMESARRMRKFSKTLLLWLVPVVVLGGFVWFLVKTTPTNSTLAGDLNSCIQHTNVGTHIHSNLTVVIYGQEQEIPLNIGVSPVCMRPIHTHDNHGKIHMEFKQVRDVKLGEFFEVWGKSFSSNNIFDYLNSGSKKVKLFVNGNENLEFENYIMKDGDKIEVRYE